MLLNLYVNFVYIFDLEDISRILGGVRDSSLILKVLSSDISFCFLWGDKCIV